MKAAIYCRVSTDNQEREGTSLDSQLEACLKKASELGYDVPKNAIILETYSGLTLDRIQLPHLRQWVRDKEVDNVIAYTLDRLSRDPVHFLGGGAGRSGADHRHGWDHQCSGCAPVHHGRGDGSCGGDGQFRAARCDQPHH